MTINWEVIIWTCITLAVLMSVIGLILYAISAKNVRSKRKELGEVHTELKVGSRISRYPNYLSTFYRHL